MRFRYLAVVAAVSGLAACSDSPITQAESSPSDLYDLSDVRILKPEQYAAHGVQPLAPSKSPSFLIEPREPCYFPEDCPPDEPEYGIAEVDFWGGVFDESDYWGKNVRLHAKSDSHNNMYETVVDISYRSVGGQGPYGCNATPAQFDSDHLVAYGSPINVTGERYSSYPYSMTFVWEVQSNHTFTANYGYLVEGYARTYSWPSGGRLCV
jgi:hypothetical protein